MDWILIGLGFLAVAVVIITTREAMRLLKLEREWAIVADKWARELEHIRASRALHEWLALIDERK